MMSSSRWSLGLVTLLLTGKPAAAQTSCISPLDSTRCGDCTSGGGQVTQNQCVVGNNWYTCFADLNSCCSNWAIQVPLQQCLTNSGDTSKPDGYCDLVVSKNRNFGDNAACQAACNRLSTQKDPMEDPEFKANCLYQHYEVVNDRTVVDDQCFNKWVYGYSENGSSDTSAYKTINNVKSPAACQLECQKDKDCVNFLWTSDLTTGAHAYDVGLTCRLKNVSQVVGALNTRYTRPDYSDTVDTNVCNYGQGIECYRGTRICMKCDDVPRCVWKSDRHVAGWKYCGEEELCAVPNQPTLAPPTLAPPTTMPHPTTKRPTSRTTITTTHPLTTPESAYPDIPTPRGQKLIAPYVIE